MRLPGLFRLRKKSALPIPAEVIFNPGAGNVEESPAALSKILLELQKADIAPEVHIVTPETDIDSVLKRALRQDRNLIIVCGGDGTIDHTINALAGSNATLGVIPKGTRNNLALSLGIPFDVRDAIEVIRTGDISSIDLGLARCGEQRHHFLEFGSIGLASALFPSSDDLQKGNLLRLPEWLDTFIRFPLMRMQIETDDQHLEASGHMAAILNLPYAGANFMLSPEISCSDGLLDLFIFSDMSKIDIITYAAQAVTGAPSDPRVQHYRVKKAHIATDIESPVMADGIPLGQGELDISIEPGSLNVITHLQGASETHD
jgi:YegS/Rv2252/BmrU family lipid kinase